MREPPSPEGRFWASVDKGPQNECWMWLSTIRPDGYGLFSMNGKQSRAHRISYEMHIGPIPDGLVIDHLCRTPACVNPRHLEAVTDRVNILRGTSPPAKQAQQTHCLRGHKFTPENTYNRPDRIGRLCRKCIRIRWKRQANVSYS